MDQPGILIADKDTETRRIMVEILTQAGYKVKTTDSAAEVLSDILKKNTHTIVVGSDFDEKVAAEDLIPMIKKCDSNLTIILVSDEQSLSTLRRIRREGIFFHALKPVNTEDKEELCSAVECAFKKVVNVLSVR